MRKAYKAPEPPEDFKEHRWTGLLFETTCEVGRTLFLAVLMVIRTAIAGLQKEGNNHG
jgi:hypothetical protein